MKYSFSILITFLTSLAVYGQPMPRSAASDTLVTSEGTRFIVGEDITLGTGTMQNGDFKFVTPSRASWTVLTGTAAYKNVPAKFSGHKCSIKAIKLYGSKKHGYVPYLMLGGGEAMNWECDIQNALKAGEVSASGYTPITNHPVTVQLKATGGLADELRQLKALKDEGLLTETEYQEQKKKLLAK